MDHPVTRPLFYLSAITITLILALGPARGEQDGDSYRPLNRGVDLPKVLAGAKLCGNMTTLAENGAGFGYSPGISGLIELDLFKFAGYRAEFGYGQSRLPVEEGEIRSDYLKGSMYALVRLSDSRGLAPYLIAGAYVKKLLTSNYIDNYDGTEYRFEGHYREYDWGIGAGAGLAYGFAGAILFAEFLGSGSLGGAMTGVESNVVLVPESSETELQISLGVKFLAVDGNDGSADSSLREKILHGSRHGKNGTGIGK